MDLSNILFAVLSFLCFLATIADAKLTDCPCGWRLTETSELFTHRILNDFSQFEDVDDLVHDSNAISFAKNWYIYNYEDTSSNITIRLNAKYQASNVRIGGGRLRLHQRAYTQADRQASAPISVSGMQTRELDMLHGSFRIQMQMSGANGGACASFFWYHDNNSEIDIEAVTQGTSLVNNTINYTSHPSLDLQGNPIQNATLSVPMGTQSQTIATMREHRFDCSPGRGVRYFLDGQRRHIDHHNIPQTGGNLQLKLWADGNQWWSGIPSTTDVTLEVASIMAYFNTSRSNRGDDTEWQQRCQKAGGPSQWTICDVPPVAQLTTTSQRSACSDIGITSFTVFLLGLELLVHLCLFFIPI